MVWPILDDLALYGAMVRPSGDAYIRGIHRNDMELAFVCMGKISISMESAEYFPNMGFVLGNVVRIDEDVVQNIW